MISFRLLDGLQGLRGVGAHGDLCHVDIAVGHGDLRQGLRLGFLTGSRELRDLTDVGSLGSLSAGVGVDLGIEDEDVDVFAGGEDMVDAAEADVVSPAVAAEDPDGLLGRGSPSWTRISAPSLQASQSQYFSPLAFSSAACAANCGISASSSTVQTFSSRAAT